MLTEAFYWVLNMSILGIIPIAAVLLLRLIKPLPKRAAFALWAIPLLRLTVPFGIASKISIINLIDGIMTKNVRVPDTAFYTSNTLRLAESYFPLTYKENSIEGLFRIIAVVWVSVSAVLLLAFTVFYVRARLETKQMERGEDNIRISAEAKTACVVGVIKPVIVVPFLCEEHMELVLLHERMHIRRLDNLWRLLAIAVCCAHWFNPIVWVALRFFFYDMERACDESVLAGLGAENKERYALALIEYKEQRTLYVSAFGGAGTKSRIKSILSYKKLTVFSAAASTALVALTAAILLTNASR